jgi:serine/threonine protein kinase
MSGSAHNVFAAGAMLGRYRVEAIIGRGGMGIVYRARDTVLRRTVALKQLAEAADDESFRRFQRETQAAARLNHPHVVTVFEACVLEHQPILVMEYVDGGSLQDLMLRNGSLRWIDATRAILAACKGLNVAHQAGLIHRDLKPANLLRTSTGIIKVSDFGLVRDTQATSQTLTSVRTVLGTPHFMSPEQCRGDAVDELTDIYSLGVTYYTLLTGKPPFEGTDAIQLMFAHCSMPVPDPLLADCSIPQSCSAIIQRAMAKEPCDRFGTALEMGHALRALLNSSGDITPRETRIPKDAATPAKQAVRDDKFRQAGKPKTNNSFRMALSGVAITLGLIAFFSSGLAGNRDSVNQGIAESRPLEIAVENASRRVTDEDPRRPESVERPVAPVVEINAENWLERSRQVLRRRDWQAVQRLIGASPRILRNSTSSEVEQITIELDVLTQALAFRDRIANSGVSQIVRAPVTGVAFSRDGMWFAAASSMGDGGACLWNFVQGTRQLDWRSRLEADSAVVETGFRQVAFTPQSDEFVLGRFGGTSGGIELWKTTDVSRDIAENRLSGANVRSLAFHSNARGLAVALDPQSTTPGRIVLLNAENGAFLREIKTTERFVWALEFQPAGPGILAIGYENGIVELVHVFTKEVSFTINVRAETGRNWDKPIDLAFSPNGQRLAIVHGPQLHVWDVVSRQQIQKVDLDGERADAVAWSPDGLTIATGSGHEKLGLITLWDAETLSQRNTLKGHTNRILSLAFCPNDTILASGSADHTFRFWDVSRPNRAGF